MIAETRGRPCAERRGLGAAAGVALAVSATVIWAAWPTDSPFRAADGSLAGAGSPLMRGMTPLLLLMALLPSLAYGRVAGTQAAFRIGDGPMNLMSPLLPYFPLVLAFCRRYVTTCGLGAIMALVRPSA